MIADYGLILDGLIVVLLCATVVYAATLNRRIVRLRDNRAELELAARAMADAAAKADAGIKGLKLTAGSVGAAIQSDIEKARTLRDELTFLVEAGEAMAGRLEAAASGIGRAAEESRPRSADPQPAKADPKVKRNAPEGRTDRAKRDLMKTIENLR
jgi:hypothetical protein